MASSKILALVLTIMVGMCWNAFAEEIQPIPDGTEVALRAGFPGKFGVAIRRRTVSIDFTQGALPSFIDFYRASSGTYTNSSKVIALAGVDVPRFDYDPVSGAPLGLLYEKQSINLVPNSKDFSAWSTVSYSKASGFSDPFGGTTANVVSQTSAGTARVTKTASIVDGTVYTMSAMRKISTTSAIQLAVDITSGGGGTPRPTFDMATGSVTVAGIDGSSGEYSSNLGNGWFRNVYNFTGKGTTADIQIVRTYTIGSNAFVAHAQLEAGSVATSPIITAGSAGTRANDEAIVRLPIAGTRTIVFTFDDNSKQSVSGSFPYTIPTTLNRPRIKSMAVQ